MSYGIHPFSKIEDAYVWRFADLEAAKAEALRLADAYHVEIMVFQVVGSFKPTSAWLPEPT